MPDLTDTNRLILVGVVVLVLLVAWWLLRRSSGAPRQRDYKPDVLDEGQAPAARNQALIDAPPAARIITPLPGAGILGGVGEVVAAAAQDEVASAEARLDASPGVPVDPATPGGADLPPAVSDAAERAEGDDLSRIKGLGPKLQALLPQLGITTYAQIAAMSEADLAALDAKLGPFAGRPARDNWVAQAQFLAQGDVAGFEEKFGKV
ncbi:MAG: hypothetical protein JSR28_18475 [Proteobacteria bacterium]|nr:hypothetical protein [Pseudomonadota bacterium]MDE2411452.1 hypothetical protein [Sphingomonadales bacterium]